MDAYRLTLITVLVVGVLLGRASAGDAPFVVAGYLPEYRLATWSQETGPVTDVIFFGMAAPADGRFDAAALSNEHLALVRRVKERSKCRLLFTVGGWNKSAGFPALAADPALREQFVRDAREFCVQNDFDGIDYDWEHPRGAEQVQSYADLLKETRAQFAPQQLIVTIAMAGWQELGPAGFEALDRVHLMSYDQRYPQATFEKAQDDVKRLVDAGCPPAKIVLGVPFYGRNQQGDAKTYAELVRNEEIADDVSEVDGYAFNGKALLARKVSYARERGLGGLMIWELGQDLPGPKSLLAAIGEALKQ